jgi:UDP-N-acetylmuramoyl-tripeptide--D-alanyl-D-alanine ligase
LPKRRDIGRPVGLSAAAQRVRRIEVTETKPPTDLLAELDEQVFASSGIATRVSEVRENDVFFALPAHEPRRMVHRLFWRGWGMLELHAPVVIQRARSLLTRVGGSAAPLASLRRLAAYEFNGNAWASAAVERGARLSVVDQRQPFPTPRCVQVDDVRAALRQIATLHRRRLNTPCIGITGSCGKTTTTGLVARVLREVYTVAATSGNENDVVGVCKTILSMNQETEIAVVEMGTTGQATPIDAKCRIALPTHGIITNIGKAHLQGLGSLEGVARVKGQLFDYLSENGGHVFLNLDDERVRAKADTRLPHTSYGEAPGAQICGKVLSAYPFLKVRWLCGEEGAGAIDIETQLVGAHNLTNVLAAIAVGVHFGVPAGSIQKAIESYAPAHGRSQLLRKGSTAILLDAYNANPMSMRAALLGLARIDMPRKVAVLGDMLELGRDSRDEHRRMLELAAELEIDLLVLVGKEFGKVHDAALGPWFRSVAELRTWFQRQQFDDTCVLLKGSHAIRLESIL